MLLMRSRIYLLHSMHVFLGFLCSHNPPPKHIGHKDFCLLCSQITPIGPHSWHWPFLRSCLQNICGAQIRHLLFAYTPCTHLKLFLGFWPFFWPFFCKFASFASFASSICILIFEYIDSNFFHDLYSFANIVSHANFLLNYKHCKKV